MADAQPAETTLLRIARGLAAKLHPQRRTTLHENLDSSLERDWGFDSLSKAELLICIEHAFSVSLPQTLLGEAETLRDVLKALPSGARLPKTDTGQPGEPRIEPVSQMEAGPAPAPLHRAEAPRTAGQYLYAAWWWGVLVAAGALLWPAVLMLPNRRLRWALVRKLARATLRLMGIRLHVTGTWPDMAETIIIANHASYLDGLVLASVVPGEPVFIAKKEFEDQLFAGPFLRRLGALFVDRADPEAAVKGLDALRKAAEAGRTLAFLPEGTFRHEPGLLPFRLGAFVIAAELDLRVVPLVMCGTRAVLPADRWFPRRHPVAVWVGAPAVADGADFSAAIRLRDLLRAEMLARCGEPDASPARAEIRAPGPAAPKAQEPFRATGQGLRRKT